MKIQSLFLLLCLTFSSITQASGSMCADLFGKAEKAKSAYIAPVEMRSSGDVLLDMFGEILKAPNNSTVKIFTKNVSSDGIGALLLLVSVSESGISRGLKFEFYFEEGSKKFRIHDLYTENSSNKIRFKDTAENEFSNKTTVVIESRDGIKTIGFDGDLTSESLKDSENRTAVQVNYGGTSVLRASPFKIIRMNDQVDISKLNTEAYNLDFTTPINMNPSDMMTINQKASDLALQLYMLKKNQIPKKALSSLGILKELLK